MDLKQIAQNLNEIFCKPGGRKLIFWYDAEAEFVDDVDAIELCNAKIYRLEKDNQSYSKYFLELSTSSGTLISYAFNAFFLETVFVPKKLISAPSTFNSFTFLPRRLLVVNV